MELQGASRGHILAIPYPLMGHMTPMIQLCKMLIAKGRCRVTMVSTERDMPSLLKLLPKEHEKHYIKVVSISDGLPLDLGPPDWGMSRKVLRARNDPHHGLARSFEPLIPNFSDAVCIISDVHLRWTQDVANRLGVPRIALWVSAAVEFQVYHQAEDLINSGKLPFKAPKGRAYERGICNMILERTGRPPIYHRVDGVDEACNEEKIEIPGISHLSRRDFPTFLQIEDPSDVYFYTWIDITKSCWEASMVLINTFDALEGTILALIKSSGIPVYPIGPLFLLEDVVLMDQISTFESMNGKENESKDGEQESKKDVVNNVLQEGPNDCIEWLDNQNPRSVLYVAFGTLVHLTQAQINELALGLKASKQPFIWALPLRMDGKGEQLPKNFLGDIKGKGIVLNWAPQKRILQHPSIGAFLSHCGWNSIIEAICSAVPMICLPFVCDQTLHCKMMVEEWEVALRLERNLDDTIALANDISLLTQEILLKEKGNKLRERAQELMIAAKNSIQVGGSSRLTLDAILKMIN